MTVSVVFLAFFEFHVARLHLGQLAGHPAMLFYGHMHGVTLRAMLQATDVANHITRRNLFNAIFLK